MIRVARDKLDKQREEILLQALLAEIKKLNSTKGLENFLDQLLTRREKLLLFRRLAVIELIRNGKKYREIKNLLNISGGTISSVKDILSGRGYNKRLPKKEKISTSKGESHLSKMIKSYPSYSGKGRWKFLNQI